MNQARPGSIRFVRSALLRETQLADLADGLSGQGVTIGLIDGPVATSHQSLHRADVQVVSRFAGHRPPEAAAAHATLVASMLVGSGPHVVGLCRSATLLNLPVVDTALLTGQMTTPAVAERLANAVLAAAAAGADVVQLGFEFAPYASGLERLEEAMASVARSGVRTVLPAGNGGGLDESRLLGTPGAIPVAMAARDGTPHPAATYGGRIAAAGLLAPGAGIPGAVPPDGYGCRTGSSLAAAFVTGAFALLRAGAHGCASDAIWAALTYPDENQVRSLLPRRLDGWCASRRLATTTHGGQRGRGQPFS